MASWSTAVSLRGKNGLSVLAGNGAPGPLLGEVGSPGYVDVQNNRLYGPKTAQGWPTTFVDLKATLPTNLQVNSIILAPVQGETLATQITLKNSSGTTVFSVDATGAATALSAALGALSTTGAANVGGALGVVGPASAGRFIANSPGSASSPMLAYTANGSGTAYTCGLYSDSIKSEMYEMVANRLARSVTFVGTTPSNSDPTFFTHSFYSGVGSDSASYRFFVAGGGLALQILGSGNATFYGQLTANGLATTAGLKLSSGAVTFADGTTQSTAVGAAATPATYAATSTGSAASPAFRYGPANNGAGLYFDGAQGNTLVSVNGFKSLYSTSAANAASGANGWAIASTLGAGSPLLALFGSASTTVPVASVDGAGALVTAGLHKTAGLTLTSGALTFADGTAMTTAATGSGGGSGGGTGQLRYGTGAPSTTNPAVQFDGDSYIDQQQSMLYGPRANGVWPTTPVSLIGATGPAGYTSLPNATLIPGPTLAFGNLALSSTPTTISVPGTTNVPQAYYPQGPSAFLGLGVSSFGPAFALELYDVTAQKSIYTLSVAANANLNTGVFSNTQYPMTSGNQHVWRVTGSGSGVAQIQPTYLAPSSTATPALCTVGGFTTAAGTAFSSTAIDILSYGQSSIRQRNIIFTRTASVVGLVGCYVPSAAGAAAASVTITVGTYNYNSGAVVTLFTTSQSLPNNGTPQSFGPYAVGTYGLPPGTLLFMRAQGSGTGQVNVDAQIVT